MLLLPQPLTPAGNHSCAPFACSRMPPFLSLCVYPRVQLALAFVCVRARAQAAEALMAEAVKRWLREEAVVDDVTCIVVFLSFSSKQDDTRESASTLLSPSSATGSEGSGACDTSNITLTPGEEPSASALLEHGVAPTGGDTGTVAAASEATPPSPEPASPPQPRADGAQLLSPSPTDEQSVYTESLVPV